MQLPIFENYKVKVTSLLVAVVFWFAVVTESNYQYEIEVRIQPVNVPADRIIVNALPEKARVRFEGNGKSLLALWFSNEATLEINLENVNADAFIRLNESMLRIPRRSRNINAWYVVSPDTVFVRLAYLERKRVPVVPQIKIEVAPAFTLVGKIRVVPDSVEISGPIHRVRQIERINTEEQIFTNRQRPVHGKVLIRKPPDSLKVSVYPSVVEFYADVQKLLEQTFTEVPVEVVNVPRRFQVTPRPSRVSLVAIGGESYIMSFRARDFKVLVDFNQSNDSQSFGYAPIVQHPPDLRISEVIPPFIKLEIEQR